uniref:Uncharacterized protein n=1 Tax=viral metagenome TaxID=1070528 RepID=A0A6C0LI10_9ZZZZ
MSDCSITVGGINNHIVDKFNTTVADKTIKIENKHSTGLINLKLGTTDNNTKFEIQDSNGNSLFIIDGIGVKRSPEVISSGNLSVLQAIVSPVVGQKFRLIQTESTFHYDKLCYYTGRSWQVEGETIEMLSDGALTLYKALEQSTSDDFKAVIPISFSDNDVIGILVFNEPSGANEYITVAVRGIWPVGMMTGSYNTQQYVRTSSSENSTTTTTPSAGVFGITLEAKTISVSGDTLICFIHSTEAF